MFDGVVVPSSALDLRSTGSFGISRYWDRFRLEQPEFHESFRSGKLGCVSIAALQYVRLVTIGDTLWSSLQRCAVDDGEGSALG